VDHLSFLEARGVVFEPDAVIGFVNAKTTESIGVGKETQSAKLAGLEGEMKFVGDFDERHEGIIIAVSAGWGAEEPAGRSNHLYLGEANIQMDSRTHAAPLLGSDETKTESWPPAGAAKAQDSPAIVTAQLDVRGMHCASCVAHIEKALGKVEGVRSASVNLAAESAEVTFDEGRLEPEALIVAVRGAGYDATVRQVIAPPAPARAV
jgi:copper ion binding protein